MFTLLVSSTKTDPALYNATLDDPACTKAGDACLVVHTAHKLSQKKVSYYHQYDYGHNISWYLVATFNVFILSHRYRQWTEGSSIRSSPPFTERLVKKRARKTRTMIRYISYRRMPGKLLDFLRMPPAGILVLTLLFTLYCLILSFVVRPYHRQHRGYGSPPLAVRTGLMTVALTP